MFRQLVVLCWGILGVVSTGFAADWQATFERRQQERRTLDAQIMPVTAQASQVEQRLATQLKNGALDPTWRGDSAKFTLPGYDVTLFADMVPTTDGRYFVAGNVRVLGVDKQQQSALQSGLFVARLLGNGNLDASFGTNGFYFIRPAEANYLWLADLFSLDDGSVLVLVGFEKGNDIDQAQLLKLSASGVLDRRFNGTGMAEVPPLSGKSEWAGDGLAVQADGKIVMVGAAWNPMGANEYAAIWRFHADGRVDRSFGNQGIVEHRFCDETYLDDVLVVADQQLLLHGECYAEASNTERGLLARVQQDGQLDTTFGNGQGYRLLDMRSVQLQPLPNGKLLVLSRDWIDGEDRNVLSRFEADGRNDIDFGAGGDIELAVPSALSLNWPAVKAVNLLPDGDMLLSTTGSIPGEMDGRYSGALVVTRLSASGDIRGDWGTMSGSVLYLASEGLWRYLVSSLATVDGKLLLAWNDSSSYYADDDLFSSGGDALSVRVVTNDSNNDEQADGWDVTPDSVSFPSVDQAEVGAWIASNTVTVAGLSDDVQVPMKVVNGEFALDGATTWSSGSAWVRNGTTITLRHQAGRTTELTVGGMLMTASSELLSGDVVRASFKSTVPAAESSRSGGGGTTGFLFVLLLAVGAVLVRRS